MTETTENIRRLNNGAIDTAYYVNRGHVMRARTVHRSLNRIRYDAAGDLTSLRGMFRKFRLPLGFWKVETNSSKL